ncbi:hypothetical protein CEQ90_20275 [Lewinellaceae bacterium SD302]|nr:hypothetical protein CEQ90_20275 [Lewinellaceae bacterium SD302]
MNSGRHSSRGYLVQALAAVLSSFGDDWLEIKIEPDTVNDKVDILWFYNDKITAAQVKSSINNFTERKVYDVLADLISDYQDADKFVLYIVGNCNDKLLRKFRNFDKIGDLPSIIYGKKDSIIVEVNPLNLDTLYNAIYSKVHKFLSNRGYILDYESVKLIAEGIVLKFVNLSTGNDRFSKVQFENKLLKWVNFFYEGNEENRLLDIGFVSQSKLFTKEISYKDLSNLEFALKDKLYDQIQILIESILEINLIPNQTFDYRNKAVAIPVVK